MRFHLEVENLLWNALPKLDYIISPSFKMPVGGSNTEWRLQMYPSQALECFSLFLTRTDDGKPSKAEVGFELSCVTADGNIRSALCVDRKCFFVGDSTGFVRDPEIWKWCDLLKERSLYFPDGSFTVVCRMWTTSSSEKSSLEYVAVTRIKATRFSYRKSIPISKVLSSDYEVICFALTRDELQIMLSRRENSEYISLKMHCKASEMDHKIRLNCKFSFLDSTGILLHKMEQCNYFSTIFDSDIWNIPNSIKLEDVMKKVSASADAFNLEFVFVMGTDFIESNIIELKYFNKSDSQLNEVPKTGLDLLSREFEILYKEKKYADVQLKTGENVFSVHKNVLCTRSPVFSAMFDSDMAEKKSGLVEIKNVDAPTLDKLLLYLYTGQVKDFDESMAMKLLAAADKYQIISLKEQCAISLQKFISIQNSCQILQLADMHHEESLKHAAQDFICRNHRYIFSSEEWTQFIRQQGELTSEIFQKLSVYYFDF